MNPAYQPFFDWLLRSTLNAAFLIALIFGVKAVVRSRLSARWHHALWVLLIFRMVFPWGVDSAVPGVSLLPETVQQGAYAGGAIHTAEPMAPIVVAGGKASPVTGASVEMGTLLVVVWAAGALLLLGITLCGHVALLRQVRRDPLVKDKAILRLLDRCKKQMGVTVPLDLVTTDYVKTPALLGMIKPRILLPASLAVTLERAELKHIFLHELAHIRRKDILIRWLTAVLQAVHWFNPFVWMAFRRMQQDRELAADGLALSIMQASEKNPYGKTLVRLVERFSTHAKLPTMAAGLLENNAGIKRRIKMISTFGPGSYRWSPAALFVFACLGGVSLLMGNTSASAGSPGLDPIPLADVTNTDRAADDKAVDIKAMDDDTVPVSQHPLGHLSSETSTARKPAIQPGAKLNKKRLSSHSRSRSKQKRAGAAKEDPTKLDIRRPEAPQSLHVRAALPSLTHWEAKAKPMPIPAATFKDTRGIDTRIATPSAESLSQKTSSKTRVQSIIAEIARYNADPKNKDNPLICKEEVPTGSHIPHIICKTKRQRRMEALNAEIVLSRIQQK
ncbi:MAG: M56 family metallopeptidase [Myxococcota bacterium]|nr:M56 family metallopeptidase [Myxococcota bacterium]